MPSLYQIIKWVNKSYICDLVWGVTLVPQILTVQHRPKYTYSAKPMFMTAKLKSFTDKTFGF